jgi:hypothetical protein
MGICSKPLFAHPAKLTLPFADLSEHHRRTFTHNALAFAPAPELSLDAFVRCLSGTAKVWGYFSRHYLEAWQDLLRLVLARNSTVDDVSIHFQCKEDRVIFYIGLNRAENFVCVYHAPFARHNRKTLASPPWQLLITLNPEKSPNPPDTVCNQM